MTRYLLYKIRTKRNDVAWPRVIMPRSINSYDTHERYSEYIKKQPGLLETHTFIAHNEFVTRFIFDTLDNARKFWKKHNGKNAAPEITEFHKLVEKVYDEDGVQTSLTWKLTKIEEKNEI